MLADTKSKIVVEVKEKMQIMILIRRVSSKQGPRVYLFLSEFWEPKWICVEKCQVTQTLPIFIPSVPPLPSSETQYKIVYGKLSYQKGSFEVVRFCVKAISIKASFDRMAIWDKIISTL